MSNFQKIKISVEINSNIDKVWEYWTVPKHVCNWNYASDDWHNPSAISDFTENGKFVYRMEAKDGSFGFDFSGKFLEIIEKKMILILLDDDRKVELNFDAKDDSVVVFEEFEAENVNPLELQEFGWQSILNNFKKYCENN